MKYVVWGYLVPVGFIIGGIYLLKYWRAHRNPTSTKLDKVINQDTHLRMALVLLIAGVLFLIIRINHGLR